MSSKIAVWFLLCALSLATKPAAGQTARVGMHYGAAVRNGEIQDDRLGVQASVHLLGPLETGAAFSVFVGWPGVDLYTGSAWHGYWSLRVRPSGVWSMVSAGYGLAVTHEATTDTRLGTSTSYTYVYDAFTLGLEAPTPYVRPFADLYLLRILDRSGSVGVNVLVGLQVVVPLHPSR
jgi:hypothetical protein